MSSETDSDTVNSRRYTPSGVDYFIEYHGHKLHTIEPLTAVETFVIAEFNEEREDDPDFEPIEYGEIRGLLRKFRDRGILTVPGYSTVKGTTKLRYRWTPGAREKIRAYLDQQDRLPCGHRWHIHNPRETPDGILGCKDCDETFTREAVLEAGGRS